MHKYIFNEFNRQFNEMKQFKINIFFANFSIFILVTSYLKNFGKNINVLNTFAVLFSWYLSTHSITHPSYFLEDEILDGTLITIVQSGHNIIWILVSRIVIQILLDLIKAIPLFVIIAIILKIRINSCVFIMFTVAILSTIGLYGIGILVSSFSLIIHKISNVGALLSYFILFFAGVINPNYYFAFIANVLPFKWLYMFFESKSIKALITVMLLSISYWLIGIVTFHFMYRIALRKGSLFHV